MFLLVIIESFPSKILFNSSSPTVANRPSAMFVYPKQKIQWRLFAKTRNLLGRLEMKSRLWLNNVETPNRLPEAHANWTHSEVQPRKYCLGQSAKSKIPYHLITSYIDCPLGSGIDFNTDKAFTCGSGIITASVNTTVPWAVYKSR